MTEHDPVLTVSLEQLGPRICILGPSNSGKSTLASAISRKRDSAPVVHLDQLFFQPHTNYVPRPAEEFDALHEAAVQGQQWLMEGNFKRLLPERVERATGVILLDIPITTSLYRYLRRAVFGGRIGGLEGGSEAVNWEMIHWITIGWRSKGKELREMYDDIALPKVRFDSTAAIDEFYRANGLNREEVGRELLRGQEQDGVVRRL